MLALLSANHSCISFPASAGRPLATAGAVRPLSGQQALSTRCSRLKRHSVARLLARPLQPQAQQQVAHTIDISKGLRRRSFSLGKTTQAAGPSNTTVLGVQEPCEGS